MIDKFRGAWIFPNGKIYHTNNIDSHIIVIKDELQLQNDLLIFSKTINWNKNQLKNHLNSDLIYLAMYKGYIRVTSFLDQFAIQYVNNNFNNEQINSILKIYTNLNTKFKTFVIEQYASNYFKIFDNIYDLIDFIK